MYFSTSLAVLFLISSFSGFGESRTLKHLHRRIVNSKTAFITDWPFIARLSFHQEDAPYKICGGALIKRKYVVTAGHCVQGTQGDYVSVAKPESITVTLGSTLRQENAGSTYKVAKITQHPLFKEINAMLMKENYTFDGRLDYDIAVLELSNSAAIGPNVALADYHCEECGAENRPDEDPSEAVDDNSQMKPIPGPENEGGESNVQPPTLPEEPQPTDDVEDEEQGSTSPENTVSDPITPVDPKPQGSQNDVSDAPVESNDEAEDDLDSPASGSDLNTPSENQPTPIDDSTLPQENAEAPLPEEEGSGPANDGLNVTPNAQDPNEPAIEDAQGSADEEEPLLVEEDMNFKDCAVAGWGREEEFESTEDFGSGAYTPALELQQGQVKMLTEKSCKTFLKRSDAQAEGDYSDKILCGTYKRDKSYICLGDSGSPLVCKKEGKKYLAGIAAVGNFLCKPDGGAMLFTKVKKYQAWIDSIINAPVEQLDEANEEEDTALPVSEESELNAEGESSAAGEEQPVSEQSDQSGNIPEDQPVLL